MVLNDKHILVLGVGSVGKRHLRNMVNMNCELSAMDPNTNRLHEASKEVNLAFQFTNLKEIDRYWHMFDGVIVCSPPKFHKEQCIIVSQKDIPILLEKPLTKNLREGIELYNLSNKSNRRLLLGYTYRWWQPLIEFRRKLNNGKVGKLLHAKFFMSAHLADWHPWERYQDFFMASKDLGGGALLDESHFIDLMMWFFGLPESIYASVEKISDLEIDTDDNVDIVMKYENGLRVIMHLDLYGRPHEKYISVTGDKGTLEWSFDPNQIRYSKSIEHNWKEYNFAFERNDMFVNVSQDFLKVIDGKSIKCTINEGVNVMRIIEACRISSKEGRVVLLDEIPNIEYYEI